jgi:hypothetical protein
MQGLTRQEQLIAVDGQATRETADCLRQAGKRSTSAGFHTARQQQKTLIHVISSNSQQEQLVAARAL